MKLSYIIIICFVFVSCFFRNASKNQLSKKQNSITEKDSLEQLNYRLLKEFAICRCLYSVPENQAVEAYDISPSIYADILNYVGIDTLSLLAKKEGQNMQPSKYGDYHNKKAIFYRCSQWANSSGIDSLIRKYAAFSVAEGVWEYDTTKPK